MIRCLPASLLLAFAFLAQAHDLYLMPEKFVVSRGPLVVALHDGDAFPESEVPMAIQRLRDGRIWNHGSFTELNNPRVDRTRVLTDSTVAGEGSLLISGRTSPNFIQLEPKEFLAYLKEEGLQHVIDRRVANKSTDKPGRERYSKFFKAIILSGKPDDGYRQIAGHTIEIVPGADPNRLRAGADLPVQVLFQAKPTAGLQVEVAWAGPGGQETKIIGRTDKDGRVTVPLPKPGKYRLHTLLMEPCAEPALADWESSWASLTFEIR